MYLAPPVAAVVLLLAAVGALALVTSVGVFVFTAGLPDAPELPASEVVAAHTGNVRVVPPNAGGLSPVARVMAYPHTVSVHRDDLAVADMIADAMERAYDEAHGKDAS